MRDRVRVTVTNASAAAPERGRGLGLTGMAERARLLGGTLQTTYADGTFEISAWLPAPDRVPR